MGRQPHLKYRPTPRIPAAGRVIRQDQGKSPEPPQAADEQPRGSRWSVSGSGSTVSVEHAVFTSMRSPTGEGYRIIAASKDVSTKDRSEITRRCPSHGGLCCEDEDAWGLLGFPLPSGRIAVAVSRHAGTEHTARGGLRVWTHVAMLDAATYRRFACNPVRVRAALREAGNGMAAEKLDPILDGLEIRLPAVTDELTELPPTLGGDGDTDQLGNVLTHVLSAQPMILAGIDSSLAVLETIVTALPLFMRSGFSFSIGVRYSPGRQIDMALVDPDNGETLRKLRGQKAAWFQMGRVPAGDVGQYRNWIALAQRWWEQRRHNRLCCIANRIGEPVPPAALGWVATICTDMDRISGADSSVLDDLSSKYNGFMADTPLEAELVQDLLLRLEQEREHLAELEEQSRPRQPSSSDPVVHHVSSPSDLG